jgi:hypothetical protein
MRQTLIAFVQIIMVLSTCVPVSVPTPAQPVAAPGKPKQRFLTFSKSFHPSSVSKIDFKSIILCSGRTGSLASNAPERPSYKPNYKEQKGYE